ncbi:MAG: nucleotidyltransferase family protein [Candidatus Kapaibacterium sp.]
MIPGNIRQTIELIESLNERAKELQCLYRIEDILKDLEKSKEEIFNDILKAIPPGWQFPEVCEARVKYNGNELKTAGWKESDISQETDILVDGIKVGEIEVVYTEKVRLSDGKPFLPEEQKLLDTISYRISAYLFNKRVKDTFGELSKANMALEALHKSEGRLVKLLMNADPSEAAEYLRSPHDVSSYEELEAILETRSDKHWKWRNEIAEKIAESLDPDKFAVKAIYLFGSTKDAECGPGSDIDLLIHFNGTEEQRELLKTWLEGWSLCLSEMNQQKTGYETKGLLDIHIVTDKDIDKQDSYATLINSSYDPAKLLKSYKK